MPTNKRPATVEIDYQSLLSSAAFDVVSILAFIHSAYEAIKFGGSVGCRDRISVFDTDGELWTLPLGVLERKNFLLPRRHLPKTEGELKRFCRQLIDRGEDEGHLQLIQEEWPAGRTLNDHVKSLWQLRSADRLVFESIVRGRFGKALRRIVRNGLPADTSYEDIHNLILIHSLIWCAFDVQRVAAIGRVSTSGPLGNFLLVTPGESEGDPEVKVAGLTNKMRSGVDELEKVLDLYKPAGERTDDNDDKFEFDPETEAEIKTPKARELIEPVKEYLVGSGKSKREWLAETDESVAALQSMIPFLREDIDAIEMKADDIGKNAKHLSFFAAWYAGLTPVDGLSVALLRYSQAEKILSSRVAQAIEIERAQLDNASVLPLPALPSRTGTEQEKKELNALKRRARFLLDSARRTQLQDNNWRTRDVETRDLIRATVPEVPSAAKMQSDEGGGRGNIVKAVNFLRVMGGRRYDASSNAFAHDIRHRVYFSLDVVPEFRLFA